MNKVKSVLFSAGILLALAFTFGCSSGDGGENTSQKKCDGIVYIPENQFCENNFIYDKCGGNIYDPSTQDCCDNNTIFSKTTQRCGYHGYYGNRVEDQCGSNWYVQKTQFCENGIAYYKCNGNIYDPLTQGCIANEVVETKCGSNWYNQVRQYCENDNVKNYYDSITDTRDSKKYKTTVIGNQTWMAENLNYERGCSYREESYLEKYGCLYSWNTAMQACPSGWHLPSQKEWDELVDFVGGWDIAGTKLKATSGWNGTDDFGFSALPGGYYDPEISRYVDLDGFMGVGINGYWWSASPGDNTSYACGGTSDACVLPISGNGGIGRSHAPRNIYYSVRCVQN